MRPERLLQLLAVVAVAAVALGVGTPATRAAANLALQPSSGPAGTPVTARANGFADGIVSFWWDGTTLLGSATSAKSHAELIFQASGSAGPHTVRACAGLSCSANGEADEATFTVLAPAVEPTPPPTAPPTPRPTTRPTSPAVTPAPAVSLSPEPEASPSPSIAPAMASPSQPTDSPQPSDEEALPSDGELEGPVAGDIGAGGGSSGLAAPLGLLLALLGLAGVVGGLLFVARAAWSEGPGADRGPV